MRLADMNLPVPVADARRIEIVCNGLPLWHGAQLAVDTTCVSPSLASASRGRAPTLDPASLFSSQHGASVATPTSKSRRDAATALSQQQQYRLQRCTQAACTAWRRGAGALRALACARRRVKDAVSWLQRPPISMPNTTSRQRRAPSRFPVFSGALRGRARCQAEHRRWGAAFPCSCRARVLQIVSTNTRTHTHTHTSLPPSLPSSLALSLSLSLSFSL